MTYGLYISAAGANAQSERLKVLSNNLANVDTAGFKRELAILQARHAEAVDQGEAEEGSRSINDISGGVRVAETITDFSHGRPRQTNVKTDFAIDGDGFFVVQRDAQQLLTRAGNFRFAADGRLMTQQGYPVMSADGAPVAIDPRLPWSVDEDGAIQQAGIRIPLALVQPRSLGDLARAGENLFEPLAATTPVELGDRRVRSGHLESSTVRPAVEMMDLIETSRAYEANIRLIQSQDQMLGSLVNRVLRPA